MSENVFDAADAIVRGDKGFEKRWTEWLADAPVDVSGEDLSLAKSLAQQWWHMGLVRGVTLTTRETNKDWKPISTAPRNGAAILIGKEGHQPQLVRWMISASKGATEGWWFVGGYDGPRLRWQPTHWQDCPTGPATETGHILYTESDCQGFHSERRQCPVCEGGLAVCRVCGEYETGLDNPCKPRATNPTAGRGEG